MIMVKVKEGKYNIETEDWQCVSEEAKNLITKMLRKYLTIYLSKEILHKELALTKHLIIHGSKNSLQLLMFLI